MRYLKNFITFINEGAWGNGNTAYISLKNNNENPDELLKTVDPNGRNFNERGSLSKIKVYYGLYTDPPYKPRAAINQTPQGIRQAETMELLKSGNFIMDGNETFEDFIKYTLKDVLNEDINYIVRIGSSQKLVKKMSDSFNKIFPNATIIDLDKIKYDNVLSAVNWEKLNQKFTSEFYENPDEKTGKYTPKQEIDPRTGRNKNPSSETLNQVERWISDMTEDLARRAAVGEETSFNIRSSGIRGSIRDALKPKYNTAEESFINAIKHCVIGDADGNLGKMIMIDDNVNQGIDFSDLSNKSLEICLGIIDITKNLTGQEILEIIHREKNREEWRSSTLKGRRDLRDKLGEAAKKRYYKNLNLIESSIEENIEKNIIGYVLYNFGTGGVRKNLTDSEYKKILTDNSLEFFVEKGYNRSSITDRLEGSKYVDPIQMFIEDADEFISEIKNKSINYIASLTNSSLDEITRKIDSIIAEDLKKGKERFNERNKKGKVPRILPIIIKEKIKKPPHPLASVLKIGTKLFQPSSYYSGQTVTISEIDYDREIFKFDIGGGRSSNAFKFDSVSTTGGKLLPNQRFKLLD